VKAALILQPKQIKMQKLPRPVLAPDELLVRVMASGICGTDVHIFQVNTWAAIRSSQGMSLPEWSSWLATR